MPLLVGGSDGSGTRAFVDILGRLGVPMLVDDPGTMDIHGSTMFGGRGWPPMVSSVLEEQHSANYDIADLSEGVRNSSQRELLKLKSKLDLRVSRLLQKIGTKNLTHSVVKGVSYGFKAPITMLLLPLIQAYMYPQLKYLHVVRDGRDVALSTNQSPVKKFYNVTYTDGNERIQELKDKFGPVLGIQLWNDWNLQLEKWMASNAQVDHLTVRTEDLLNPLTKFESLVQLAHFIGSPRSMHELCCMSKKQVVDMGKSAGGKKNKDDKRDARLPGDMRYHFRQEKFDFMDKIAKTLGKNIDEMTPKERLETIKQFRLQHRGNVGFQPMKKDPKKRADPSLQRLGSDIAARLLKRKKQGETVDRARVFKEKLEGFRTNRRGNIKDEIRDLIGRRRLLEDGNLVERQQNQGNKHGRLDDDRKRRDWMARVDARRERLREHGWGKFNLRHGRQKGPTGDEALGNLLVEQINRLAESRSNSSNVDQRYGKWASMLEKSPELLKKMQEESAEALAHFGYEPNARFMDHFDHGFECDEAVECDDKEMEKDNANNKVLNEKRSANKSKNDDAKHRRRRLLEDGILLERQQHDPHGRRGVGPDMLFGKHRDWYERAKSRFYGPSGPLDGPFGFLRRKKGPTGDEALGNSIVAQISKLAESRGNSTVDQRYGKWASMLTNAPELLEKMAKEASEALAHFGYEPNTRFMDRSDHVFECDETVDCKDEEEHSAAKALNEERSAGKSADKMEGN